MKIERQTKRWKDRDVERYTVRLRDGGEKGIFRHRETESLRDGEKEK